VFAFLVQGIPVGLFLAAALFRYQRGSENNKVLFIHRGRIQVILWLSHLMAPMTQLLASIILYQVAGTSKGTVKFTLENAILFPRLLA
jgi:hypothetical protein